MIILPHSSLKFLLLGAVIHVLEDMAAILLYYAVGDLTIGKPWLEEFLETSSVGEATEILQSFRFPELPVWKAPHPLPLGNEDVIPSEERKSNMELMEDRFIGMIDMVDIIMHMSSPESLQDPEAGLSMPVSSIVVPDKSLLKQVAPATRLIDALELMKQGARQLLVPLVMWNNWKNGVSKKFSMIYYAKWIKSIEAAHDIENYGEGEDDRAHEQQQQQQHQGRCCLLSREDIVRFLLGCMGALAPIPLMTIEALGAIGNIQNVAVLDANAPMHTIISLRRKTSTTSGSSSNNNNNNTASSRTQGWNFETVAIVKPREDGNGLCIVGEISAFKLKRCNYVVDAARVFAEASALDFILYLSDRGPSDFSLNLHQDSFKMPERIMHTPKTILSPTSKEACDPTKGMNRAEVTSTNDSGPSLEVKPPRAKKFSSKSGEILSQSLHVYRLSHNQYQYKDGNRSSSPSGRVVRGWMQPMSCQAAGSLAAVMAQLLTYRATNIWVTDDIGDGFPHRLIGLISYVEIISALTISPSSLSDSA